MSKHKKILITGAARERISVRTSRLRLRKMICPKCAAEAEMLALDSAVTLFDVPTGKLVRLAERNAVHSIETASGHLLVCRESLRNFIEDRAVV